MANIATVLKEEITRLARKEMRSESEGLRQASARYRNDISSLKKRIAGLEQQVSRLEKALAKATLDKPEAETSPTKLRFSAARLQAMRAKLALSAADLGRLIGVSSQTIYNWESGQTRPRADQLKEIAAIRKMGKRQLKARIAKQDLSDPSE